jgi:DNA-directed RNA polymerase specialized sigma24 family protein
MRAGDEGSAEVPAALEKLCQTYWFPIFAFARRQGYTEEDAKDLTQAFFARLLERKDLQKLDPSKGKFRTFLLTSLTHFLSNHRDHLGAAKRGAGTTTVSLDAIPPEQFQRLEPAAAQLAPDQLFDQRWAMAVLEAAVLRLRAEMETAGKAVQFEVLKLFLTDQPRDGEYEASARQLGWATQSVAVAVHRMRQRYRELVREVVANTVSSPFEVEEELRYLQVALQR